MSRLSPVAFRVKDFADGWYLTEKLTDADLETIRDCGNLLEALYSEEQVNTLLAEIELLQDQLRKQNLK